MQDLIIYNTPDGRASVALYAKDGNVWLNQSQIAELFATSKPNISLHITNVLNDNELDGDSVVKYYLTTASDGKEYNVEYYSLQMIIAIGLRANPGLESICARVNNETVTNCHSRVPLLKLRVFPKKANA